MQISLFFSDTRCALRSCGLLNPFNPRIFQFISSSRTDVAKVHQYSLCPGIQYLQTFEFLCIFAAAPQSGCCCIITEGRGPFCILLLLHFKQPMSNKVYSSSTTEDGAISIFLGDTGGTLVTLQLGRVSTRRSLARPLLLV